MAEGAHGHGLARPASPHAASSSSERLQKVLALAGLGSRRHCEELIAQGRVTVDGKVATLGQKVDPEAVEVRVDGDRVNVNQKFVYIVLNKPPGVVTTADDPGGRPTVFDLVDVPQRLFPVGRLDMDSEGLLLLTNDGKLAHALMHPSFEVERRYVARVNGRPSRRQLKSVREGIELEDGFARPRDVRVLGEGHGKSLVEVVMTEGRKREVRRLLQAVGLPVERLARVAYDGVELGDLRQGKWRRLTDREISSLYRVLEEDDRGPPPEAPGSRARNRGRGRERRATTDRATKRR
ncbi:MAG: rRNA pseudouridine synthase [Actinomycetota bacterium]|nr:rRNA pseudouridine synthase [Actinomycetota bacterium]